MSALNQQAPLDLRVNTMKATPEDALARLHEDYVNCVPTSLSPLGIRVDGKVRLGGTRAFKDGLVDVQDEGSQLVALLAGARPVMRVIDYCAGAGGKTLALAAAMSLEGRLAGQLFAIDISKYRMDRMLPRLDGLAVLKAVRAAGVRTPVLILSAMGALDDRVRGLRDGSDDYLVKPFAFVELHARVDALIRRGTSADGAEPTRLQVADLEMDLLSRKVTRGGRGIPMQHREFQMLEFLMRHAGRVVTRTMLLEGVWNYHFDPQTNVIDVHISRLRQKVDKDFDVPLIHTVRGSGYKLAVEE